jgi:hypothetical protein
LGSVKLPAHVSLTDGLSGLMRRRPATTGRDDPMRHAVNSVNNEKLVAGASPAHIRDIRRCTW